MEFGRNLREYRQKAGLTQEKLAELLHVSMQAVSRWETTDALPDAALLPELADALGVCIDDLFGTNPQRDTPRKVAGAFRNCPIPDLPQRIYEIFLSAVKSGAGYDTEGGAWWKPEYPEDGYWKKEFPESDPPFAEMGRFIMFTGHRCASDGGWYEIFESDRFPFAAVLPEPKINVLRELLTGEEAGMVFDVMGDPRVRRCLAVLAEYPEKSWTAQALFDRVAVPEEHRESVRDSLSRLRGSSVLQVSEARIDDGTVTLIRLGGNSLLPLLLASAYACAIRKHGLRSDCGSRLKPV